MAKTDATSFFSQKIIKSFGFSICAEINYAEYLNDNGQAIFNVDKPHQDLKVMYKWLNNDRD